MNSEPMPENEFKVGHVGSGLWLSVQSSMGTVQQIQVNSKNEDMTKYLTERFAEFQEKYPDDCSSLNGQADIQSVQSGNDDSTN